MASREALGSAGVLIGCVVLAASSGVSAGCADYGSARCGKEEALSICLEPTRDEAHYLEQADRYFDTFDTDADPRVPPDYSEQVIRYEWPPWLRLTGFGRERTLSSDAAVLSATPSTVPIRDCRIFEVQPFVRCRITFMYSAGPCPIYEEFTFNAAGEITFVEAWSDMPDRLPMADPADTWGEGVDVRRLSTKVPGLGNAEGRIDLESEAWERLAASDPDIADLFDRLGDFYGALVEELLALEGADEEAIYGDGCGW